MFELSKDHCCATCEYAVEERRGEGYYQYNCPLLVDALQANLALAVYVDPCARCDNYECNGAKFERVHGFGPNDPSAYDNGVRPVIHYPGSM